MNSYKNPALQISNFTKFSKKVFEELNFARGNPTQYAKKITKLLNNIENNILDINGVGMYMTEGKKAFEEAITFLNTQKSIEPLALSQGILKSADELLSILILHDGIDMSNIEMHQYDIEKRMNHYGAAFGELNELIDYGTFDPEYVIINCIVCDGDIQRKERRIIFNNYIKYVGISSGLMPSERVCTVMDFAEYFYQPGELVPEYILDKFTSPQKRRLDPKRRNSADLYKEKENKFKDVNKKNNKQNDVKISTSKYESVAEMNDDMDLPENVLKVIFKEKEVRDKNNVVKILVKKTIFYDDGSTKSEIYQR